MTRVAIVAPSEQLRAELAAALRASSAFEVVSVVAAESDVRGEADVVVVARADEETGVGARPMRHDAVSDVLLSNREREILALLADGLGNKQIAARLGISVNTVKTHVELLFDKLEVSSRAEAVATGVKRGLLLF